MFIIMQSFYWTDKVGELSTDDVFSWMGLREKSLRYSGVGLLKELAGVTGL